MTAALTFSDVHKRFGRTEALRGLNLEVPRGALFGLVGPNGAGKTTAFSIACGFLREDRGEVAILGGRGFDPARLRGHVAALPQDAALGRETRCLEQLMFFARLQGITGAEARKQAERALADVGLADRHHAKTKTLSHGMLRRLGVAQALLGTPDLVLLDEPTSGLDPRHALDLREVFKRSHRQGQTIVISSHNLAELEALCDHVAFIDQGIVMQSGSTDVITGKGLQIEIALADGPAPIDAVQAAIGTDKLEWDETTRILSVHFVPRQDRVAEDVIGLALRALLDSKARVSGVRKGQSLEKKFLELS